MVSSNLNILQHSFADGNTWHHNDEFLEAKAPRKLKDRSQVDVGLSGSCLHLHGKVRT